MNKLLSRGIPIPLNRKQLSHRTKQNKYVLALISETNEQTVFFIIILKFTNLI